ncbi:oligopeptide transport system substrate-binding protein [Microbacteriaceae bacterium SG_E_30_P1]|uniref:Oligopeptide transport system substrate-binding protein n=1 Tax=Antiquaquibacter oligotrophicus TaxID=2880260 RepID=A0ABT6KK87_9MICO|nr:ABC transporter substrate-binding protein [Antiquaquibacter oligotrophicus]MDH6180380.1 oligopeptide transport system substrate-binding protein [Antiquaquibacter oligotrophicus]UDF13878.1 ABC transporter substrate-binding protein [Antiquaquibacter oligotrophicus]
MRIPRLLAATGALSVATVLALAGCAPSTGGDGGGSSSAIVTTNINEPEHALIPADTNEVGGGLALNNLFAGLVYYEADGSLGYDVAESIESEDNQLWTITLKEGKTFTDGTPVTAESFVKAWQWGAADPELLNQWWFANIEGYSPEGGEDSLALEVIDDKTFTVNLVAPQSDFPLSLGYTVYFPLPEAFYEDTAAFGEAPIGNGPYMLSDTGWVHDERISMVVNPDYEGPREPVNGGIDLVVYATQEAAYADLLSDNLDIIQQIPAGSLATVADDLGDRAIDQPAAIFQSFTIQVGQEHFGMDEEGKLRRAAISHAINREEITDVIFEGTRQPAVDFTSPVIDGWSDDVEGSDVLEYDPELAQDLWAQADAIAPWSGQFTLAYNADGDHQAWVDATVNSIRNTLSIDAVGVPFPDLASLRTEVNNDTIGGAFRTGWQFDYPGLFNILGALYITGSATNDARYSNPEYDELIRSGSTADSIEEANGFYQQAQEILFEDMPAIPLWYQSVNAGHSTVVSDVEIGWDSWPILYKVNKAE